MLSSSLPGQALQGLSCWGAVLNVGVHMQLPMRQNSPQLLPEKQSWLTPHFEPHTPGSRHFCTDILLTLVASTGCLQQCVTGADPVSAASHLRFGCSPCRRASDYQLCVPSMGRQEPGCALVPALPPACLADGVGCCCAASRTCFCKSAWTGSFAQHVASWRSRGRPMRCSPAVRLELRQNCQLMPAGRWRGWCQVATFMVRWICPATWLHSCIMYRPLGTLCRPRSRLVTNRCCMFMTGFGSETPACMMQKWPSGGCALCAWAQEPGATWREPSTCLG